jgi:hypothetical protein
MGTTGSGHLTDYPGPASQGNAKGQGGGGSGQVDRCAKAFQVKLEEIEHCEYFTRHNSLPGSGAILTLVHKKRISAVTASGEIVGHLPSSMNYLAECLKDGHTYSGVIRDSILKTPALLTVDFIPSTSK